MANTSRWKNWEAEVAAALGGRRRLRTMESYGKMATDVWFPKAMRKKFPVLRSVKVECKKRKSGSIPRWYAEAILKYGGDGSYIVLATKLPDTKKVRKRWKGLKKKLTKKYGLKTKKEQRRLKKQGFISGLVTVDLAFFKELFSSWLEGQSG